MTAQCHPLHYAEAFTLISQMQNSSHSVRELSPIWMFKRKPFGEEDSLITISEIKLIYLKSLSTHTSHGLINSSSETYLETQYVPKTSISIYWTTHLCLTLCPAPQGRTKKSVTMYSFCCYFLSNDYTPGAGFKFWVSQNKSTTMGLKFKQFSRGDNTLYRESNTVMERSK